MIRFAFLEINLTTWVIRVGIRFDFGMPHDFEVTRIQELSDFSIWTLTMEYPASGACCHKIFSFNPTLTTV
jgi:hypothetical protein